MQRLMAWEGTRRPPPEAVYARIRAAGPSFWADRGRRWCVLGKLDGASLVDATSWRAAARRVLSRGRTSHLPFEGGLVGWFAYEAGRHFERMPRSDTGPLPEIWLAECGEFACHDRESGAWYATSGLVPALAGAEPIAAPPPPSGRLVRADDRLEYENGVARILAHLRRGDCYQVNLARRLSVVDPGCPFDAWRRLRSSNPSRRGMLVETSDGAVVSNSPELLLAARGGRLLSVPIKGTAPLTAAPERLLASEKERAELTMIVDLVRSDLNRVARTGSVRAARRRVGRVGHVWHAMQRVGARLRPDRDASDAFAAIFPPGSVTGAPKIRAMEVIRDLEPVPRGVYCGAMGWFGPGGDAWWNVAIRTIQFAGGAAIVHAGAGIVLASDPTREYDETVLKAQRLLAALV